MALPQPPFRVRTIYSWSGCEEDDLGFIEGDIIEVDNLGDGNWWHGRLRRNKMAGNFPSNYVELIKSDLVSFNSSSDALHKSINFSASPSVSMASPDRKTKHHTPSSPPSPGVYSPSRSLNSKRQNYSAQREDELRFSFQSSRNYYTDPRSNAPRQDDYSPQSPYNSHRDSSPEQYAPPQAQRPNMQHSYSVPNKLDSPQQAQSYRQRDLHVTTSFQTPNDHYVQPSPTYSAPPPPSHSVPVKSQSTYNLGSREMYSPESPYSKNHYSEPDPRRSALLKKAHGSNMKPSQNSEFVAPYDPETLNQSKSSSSSNVFSYSQGSYFTSSQSSHNSSFALSDFSATSAGSYARHKYEENHRNHENLRTSASGNNLLVEERKVKNPTGLIKKFFSTKDAPPLPSVDSITAKAEKTSLEEKQMNSWIEFKVDLNRANSLSSKERSLREKRVRENEGYIIFEPHKQLSNINNNEVYQTEFKLDLNSINLTHTDSYVRKIKTSTSIMSPEDFITNELGMKYSSKLEYLRALFILCTEHFKIVETKRTDSGEVEHPIIEEVFASKRASTYALSYLFRYLAGMMGLKVEMIIGSLKTPKSIVRHYWNAVLINGEWRFIDVGLGNLTHPVYEIMDHEREEPNESFYFLAEPLYFIYTHIPDKYEEQHIVPPIDPMVALALPPSFPSFFKNGLKIQKFSNALTRLQDFEIFEIDLKVPKDIEINAMVKTKNSSTHTLAQFYWKHNERFCKIKGHLPDNSSTGFINVFSGPKGTQKSLQNIHPLSLVVPITHEGQFRPLEFVTKYPTVPAQLNDLYIKQPQNKNLTYGADYTFSISQHPSNGLNAAPSSKLKLALQSPSGKITKFTKKDQTTPFGMWELPMRCGENGVWRGLVSVDNGTSLCVFAEWYCH